MLKINVDKQCDLESIFCRLLADFGIVLEGVIEPVATSIAIGCKVPTIGIGASTSCDGQILVTEDVLGLYDAFTPKFVRKFANLRDDIGAAAAPAAG